MLPVGITIEHALAGTCKIARRMAPAWLHCDEIDSAAGAALMLAMKRFDGTGEERWWGLVRACLRGPLRKARRDWLSHGVVNRGGRGLMKHGWTGDMPEQWRKLNLSAGLESEETLASLAPESRRIIELLGLGHKPAEVAAMTGYLPSSVYTIACWARRRLRELAA